MEFKALPSVKLSTTIGHSFKDVRGHNHRFSRRRPERFAFESRNTKSPRHAFPRTPLAFRLLTLQIPLILQDIDLEDFSNNSSLTMDSATPSSSPELDQTPPMADPDTLDCLAPSASLASPSRPLPWPQNGTSPGRNHRNAPPTAASSRISPPPPLVLSLSTCEDDDFAPTPPLTPRVSAPLEEEEECAEVQSLRRAITASVALLRTPTGIKGILKPAPTLPATPPTSQLTSSSQQANASQPTQEDPESRESPSSETTEAAQAPKKSVWWSLSEEQEQKESQKPQLPASPKIHRGNRLILPDDADDELMSVRSDDMPTPPLSPSADADFISVRPLARNLFLRSSFPVSSPAAPSVQEQEENQDSSHKRHASDPAPSHIVISATKPNNRAALPSVKVAPKNGLMRSSSSSTLLQRATSQSFGSTTNLRTNTRANALIGTPSDANTATAMEDDTNIPSMPSRTQSDAAGSLARRSLKKRTRATAADSEAVDDCQELAPPTKVAKQS